MTLVDPNIMIAINEFTKQLTVPILYDNPTILDQRGTGTLFTIAQRYFLVTASHLFDGKDLARFVIPSNPIWDPNPYTLGRCTLIKPSEDFVDIAVLELLEPQTIDRVKKGWRLLTLENTARAAARAVSHGQPGALMASHWACAQLHMQHERLALHCLGLAGYEVYQPRIAELCVVRGRKVDVSRPLFPAYVFVLVVDHFWSAMRAPGVVRLIMDGARPARVPDGVVDDLRRREQTDGLIRLPKPPKPRGLQRGDRVLIREGPFADRVAVYAGMSGSQRVAVLLALFGGRVTLTLPKDAVAAL